MDMILYRWSLPLAVIAMAVAGQAAAADTPAAVPPVETLATSVDTINRMTVDVMVNGQGPFAFAVDTGADRTVVSRSLADSLALKPGPQVVLHSMAGVDRIGTAIVDRLTVGSAVATGIEAPVLPDGPLGALGLLGIDVLDGQKVVMDFVTNRMTIQDGGVRDKSDDGTIVVTARRRFGQLVLVDATVGDIKVYAIIDSGAEWTVGNEALRRTLARRRMGTEPVVLTGVTGRTIDADIGVLPKMKIGGVAVDGLRIAYADAHPFKRYGLLKSPALLIGSDLLRVFQRVSLDFETRKVRFLRPD